MLLDWVPEKFPLKTSTVTVDATGRELDNMDFGKVGASSSKFYTEEAAPSSSPVISFAVECPSASPHELAGNQVPKLTSVMVFVIIFGAITRAMLGYELAVVAVTLAPIAKHFGIREDSAYCNMKGTYLVIVACAAVGGLLGGTVADLWGRKSAFIIRDVSIIFKTALQVSSKYFWQMTLGRAFVGFGVGVGFMCFSTYVSEVSHQSNRGRLIMVQEIAQSAGILLAHFFSFLIGDRYWRWLIAVTGIASLVTLPMVAFLPESPRWLMLKSKLVDSSRRYAEKAARSIDKLLKLPLKDIAEDIANMENGLQAAMQNRVHRRKYLQRFTDFFSQYRRPLFLALFAGLAQDMMAANAVLYYSTDIFRSVGICKPYWFGLGIYFLKLFDTAIFCAIVEKFERRTFLLVGAFGMFLCHVLIGTAFFATGIEGYQIDPIKSVAACTPDDIYLQRNAVFMVINIYFFVSFWVFSWSGLAFVVASEMLPTEGLTCFMRD